VRFKKVELTRAGCEAISREARFMLENSISCRFDGDKGDRAKEERILLACADVLAALAGPERRRSLGLDEALDPVAVTFTGAAIEWMKEARPETKGPIDYIDRNGEADEKYLGKELALLRGLDQVLGAEPVAV
jgi:hypothetical protein